MLLQTLLAQATAMPGLEFWRGLAPRRFLIEDLLVDLIPTFTVLPAGENVFAAITTSPFGMPGTLPREGWEEIEIEGEYFMTLRAPVGTTPRQVVETLALEHIQLFYPSEFYEEKLIAWLQKELGGDAGTNVTIPPAPGPGPLDHVTVVDIPSPREFQDLRSEEEKDLDFLYGNGSTPPEYHGYRQECAPVLDPTYGPPEFYEQDLEVIADQTFYFG